MSNDSIRSVGIESETDLSEGGNSQKRARRARKAPRYPGESASVATSEGSASPKPHLSSLSITPTPVSRTAPPATPDSSQEQDTSGSSLSVLRTPMSSQHTPTTPGLSVNASTIEDSDSDFQSAYSNSPRESHASFEVHNHHQKYDDIDDDHPSDTSASLQTSEIAHDFGKAQARRVPPNFPKLKQHSRGSSNASGSYEGHAQPSPTVSDYTVVSRSRSGSKLSRD